MSTTAVDFLSPSALCRWPSYGRFQSRFQGINFQARETNFNVGRGGKLARHLETRGACPSIEFQTAWRFELPRPGSGRGRRHSFAIPRRQEPESLPEFLAPQRARRDPKRDAGNAGCPMHPQSVCIGRKHTVVTTGSPESPGIPCAMVLTAYSALSPATNSSCHRHRRIEGFVRPGWADEDLRRLDTSNGCQDHTALPSALASFVCAPRSLTIQRTALRPACAPDAAASTASHPNVRDDGQRPSLKDRTMRICG